MCKAKRSNVHFTAKKRIDGGIKFLPEGEMMH
jgi:hypothetical protein